MNEVSIIINGVRYDAEQLDTPITIECNCCDLYNNGCNQLAACPLYVSFVFKKSNKKVKR